MTDKPPLHERIERGLEAVEKKLTRAMDRVEQAVDGPPTPPPATEPSRHQTEVDAHKAVLRERVEQFIRCRSYSYKAFAELALSDLLAVSDRAVMPTTQCYYCGAPTKYAPTPSVEWTCNCFTPRET